jgi:DtxR family Mn-dependent transcriptional regulator
MDKKRLTMNMEDYLETILLLQEKGLVARAKDIADKLDVKKASVTSALKRLSDKELINYERYSHITLTEKGKKYAEELYERHLILKKFLIEVLNVKEEIAEENACRMEHIIDEDVIQKFSCFSDFLLKSDKTCVNISKFKEECGQE